MSLVNIDKDNSESKSPLKVIRKVIVDKLNEKQKEKLFLKIG